MIFPEFADAVSSSIQNFYFLAESEQGVAQAILRGVIDFKRDPWPSISENAKHLVQQMLEPDPKLRLTARQVLGISHSYLKLIFRS